MKIVDLVDFHLLINLLYLELTLSLSQLLLKLCFFSLLFCHLQILIEHMLQLLGLGISMFEVWALRIRWDRRRCLSLSLSGFGHLLCLKDIIFRLNFVLLFFFLANQTVETASPGRERLHLRHRDLLKVFLLLLELLLFIMQTLGSLNKIAIVGLQFVYFLLSFSVSLVFLVDLLLQ